MWQRALRADPLTNWGQSGSVTCSLEKGFLPSLKNQGKIRGAYPVPGSTREKLEPSGIVHNSQKGEVAQQARGTSHPGLSRTVDAEKLRKLLNEIKDGRVSVDEAVQALRSLPYEDLGFAKVDHHRALRTGSPEVIFSQGKTTQQVVDIASKLFQQHSPVMATRATREIYKRLKDLHGHVAYYEAARIVLLGSMPEPRWPGKICVVSAGTADLPVAEEAAVTAEVMGNRVERLYDVGVAGIHRLLDNLDRLTAANVVVVVAGMEGALPSVVAGLLSRPVIAVPTSVGYGASFGGLSALLTMLNSCASGVGVVNIDNGFGAGCLASMINEPPSAGA